jgi:hypothetical protein
LARRRIKLKEVLSMKLKVVQKHDGEGQFPTFKKGARVTLTGEESTYFKHWFPCEIEGHQTYIPRTFFENDVLVRDYNPTELVQDVGDIITVKEVVNAWLIASNEAGQTGWIPAEATVSL